MPGQFAITLMGDGPDGSFRSTNTIDCPSGATSKFDAYGMGPTSAPKTGGGRLSSA